MCFAVRWNSGKSNSPIELTSSRFSIFNPKPERTNPCLPNLSNSCSGTPSKDLRITRCRLRSKRRVLIRSLSRSKSDSELIANRFVIRNHKQAPKHNGPASSQAVFLFPVPYSLLFQIRIGISTYRDRYSASGSSGRICPADCESLNSRRTSPSFPSALRNSKI